MTATTPPASVPAELELDATERAVLSAWHVVLLRAAEPRDGARIGQVVADLLQDLGENGAGRAEEILADLRGTEREMRPAEAGRRAGALAAAVGDRSRSALVLIDLCLLVREVPGLRGRAARGILRRAADALPGLRPDDVDRVRQEIARTVRRMRLRTIRAGRAVGVAVGGAVLGVGAVGSRIGGFSAGEIEAAAVRLAVATRLVLRAEQDDDEAARRVVLALQQRIAAVVVHLEGLAARLRETDEENRWLRDELRREQERCRRLQGVLQGALDRLALDDPDAGPERGIAA